MILNWQRGGGGGGIFDPWCIWCKLTIPGLFYVKKVRLTYSNAKKTGWKGRGVQKETETCFYLQFVLTVNLDFTQF